MARSRGGLCIITPNGLEFISSRRANKALACGSAVLVRPGVIERIVVPRSALSTPGPARHSPAFGIAVKHIPEPAHDSQFGQTFLRYPQRNQESNGAAYPALARPGAGLG